MNAFSISFFFFFLGFSVSDPKLSNTLLFPNFYRVNPPQSNFHYAIKGLLQEFNWEELWILQVGGELFNKVRLQLP